MCSTEAIARRSRFGRVGHLCDRQQILSALWRDPNKESREWSCEDEVRLVLPRKDGRIKVKFDPAWLTRIILAKATSEENKNTIRLWAKERKPKLAVATTYYDATQRAIRLRDD